METIEMTYHFIARGILFNQVLTLTLPASINDSLLAHDG